jgi:ABC-type Fe3+-siderophore transport system permease subunit
MKKYSIVAAAIVSALLFSAVFVPYTDADAPDFLFDEGSGKYVWYETVPKATLKETVEASLSSAGHSVSIEGSGSEYSAVVDGRGTVTIGTSAADWRVYLWDGTAWKPAADIDAAYSGGIFAVGFCSVLNFNGTETVSVPASSPVQRSIWTSIRGDAELTGAQKAVLSDEGPDNAWSMKGKPEAGVYAAVLTAGGMAFIKHGVGKENNAVVNPYLECVDLKTGETVWTFEYEGVLYYENTTPLIVGDFIYLQSGLNRIYRIPWKIGPGSSSENVLEKTFEASGAHLTGTEWSTGICSMVCDSGTIYTANSGGKIYCLDLDLNELWSYQMGGSAYFTAPAVFDDYLFYGAYDGCLYILDKITGNLKVKELVYQTDFQGKKYGSVAAVTVIKENTQYKLLFSYNDGRGMSNRTYGIAVYSYAGAESVQKIYSSESFGITPSYLTPFSGAGFTGVYFSSGNGLYRMDTSGNSILLNGNLNTIKAPMPLVNGNTLFASDYNVGSPLYRISLDGTVTGQYVYPAELRQYSMAPVVITDSMFLGATDGGVYAVNGGFSEYVQPSVPSEEKTPLELLLYIIILTAAVLAVLYAVMRFVLKIEKPFAEIKNRIHRYLYGEDQSHNTRSKHRLFAVLLAGILLSFAVFTLSLCVGTEKIFSVSEMFSALSSSISKGGSGLTKDELLILSSRLPRTMAALGTGIGLSIAGCMYQALIRNPLVDPYIMGVSSGAGTAAVAVIAFDFTFLGLFSSQSVYVTALAALLGGLLAFASTMILAEKAGGSSVNYVLSGVIIGLVFSAVQTLMLTFAGQEVGSALSWLFGSFGNITWNKVWLIVVPALSMSFASLLWAKEFNLILLGEDEARQMGLNARLFTRSMLVLASVLTSFCVAFVGIIGFVGLVVPHLCRMILGSDHRLVMPASITFGGFLMILADLSSRTLLPGYELPVGAITTIIGIPVFAYLLIKRGRTYAG